MRPAHAAARVQTRAAARPPTRTTTLVPPGTVRPTRTASRRAGTAIPPDAAPGATLTARLTRAKVVHLSRRAVRSAHNGAL